MKKFVDKNEKFKKNSNFPFLLKITKNSQISKKHSDTIFKNFENYLLFWYFIRTNNTITSSIITIDKSKIGILLLNSKNAMLIKKYIFSIISKKK